MKARPTTPRGRAAQQERAERWTRAVDALHRHCRTARSLAALLQLCGEVDPGMIDASAVGDAGHWIVEELDALHGCVRDLGAAR